MVFIIIEIFGLPYLQLHKKKVIEPLLKKIQNLFFIYEDNLFYQKGDILIFKMRYSEAVRNKILFALKDLNQIMRSSQKDLHSFTIIAEFLEHSDPDYIQKHLYTLLFQANQIRQLFFGPGFQALIPKVEGADKSGSLLKFTSDRWLNEFCSGTYGEDPVTVITEQVMEYLYPDIGRQDQPGAQSGDALLYLSDSEKWRSQAVQQLQGRIHHDQLPEIFEVYLDHHQPFYYSFIKAVDPEFLMQVPDFLTSNDLTLWNEFGSFFEQPLTDFSFETFFTGFSLYLKAYQCAFNTRGHWPLAIFYITPQTGELELKLVKKVINFLLDCGNILPLLALPESDLPAVQTVLGHKLNYVSFTIEGEGVVRDSIKLIQEIPFLHAQILYLAGLNSGVHTKPDFVKLAELAGFRPSETAAALDELTAEELLISAGRSYICPQEIKERVKEYLGDESRRLNVSFIDALNRLTADKKISMIGIPRFITDIQPEKHGVHIFYRYCDYLFTMLQHKELKTLLNQGYSLLSYLKTPRQRQLVEFCLSFLRFRLAIRLFDQGKASLLLNQLERTTVPDEYSNDFFIETSSFYFSAGDYAHALEYAKKTLLNSRQTLTDETRYRSMNQMAYSMMSKKSFMESEEYFQMVVEDPSVSEHVHPVLKSFAAAGMFLNQFLKGNHSYALRLIHSSKAMISRCGLKELEYYRQFMAGKVEFELGHYDLVIEQFWSLLNGCKVFPNPLRKKTIQAWIGRAYIYNGDHKRGLEQLSSLEKDMEVYCFMAESFLFREDYTRSLEYIQKGLQVEEHARMSWHPVEQIVWKNGFCSVEDRAFSGREGQSLLYYYLRALEGFVNSRLGHPEGFVDLQRINRDENLSEFYPHFSLFGYLLALSVSVDRQIDQNTILGKSVKNLHERASRIDLPKAKIDFLNRNMWNRKLIEICRKNHLI